MSRVIYNNKNNEEIYEGQTIQPYSYYTIQEFEYIRYATSDKVVSCVESGDIIVSTSESSGGHITNIDDALTHLKAF